MTELAARVPMVQVASTTAGELEITHVPGQFVGGCRLYLPAATWFENVTALIAAADQIIVWAAELTPALERELTELKSRRRTGDTLILLEEEIADPAGRVFLPRQPGETLSADHPGVKSFPHVIESAQLAGRRLDEIAELTRLVDRLDQARKMPLGPWLQRVIDRLDAVRPARA